MDADGSHVRQLTQHVGPAQRRGHRPAVVARRTTGSCSSAQRRAAPNRPTASPCGSINVRTGRERRVTPWELRAGDTPDWSPNGKRILFHDNVDGIPDRLGEPVHDPPRRDRPAPAHLRHRRRHQLPRLVVLTRRQVDHLRPAAGDRRTPTPTCSSCAPTAPTNRPSPGPNSTTATPTGDRHRRTTRESTTPTRQELSDVQLRVLEHGNEQPRRHPGNAECGGQ